jgi:PAS domain S-box-containing protein
MDDASTGTPHKKIQSLLEKMWTKNYLAVFLALWTFLVAASVIWNFYRNKEETVERARIEAQAIFQHNLAYRRWNTANGGVYAEITDKNQPNPYINSPKRDVITQDGTRLTLINPFQMTKQAYELLSKQSPLASINRTISLKSLNPENAPDPWEAKALREFEKGKTEFSEIAKINGRSYMRVLKPYITEDGCLKCHGWQGYKVGDIRGAMSIAVPMEPYYAASTTTAAIILITHLFLWLMGAGAIFLFSGGLRRYQGAIEESERKFRIVSEFAYDFDSWITEDGRFVFMSPSCERMTGYSQREFMEEPDLLNSIIHPDDRDTYKNHIADFRAPVHEEMEFRIVGRDGQVRWVSHVCGPIYVNGEFLGRRASNRDITEKKKLEDKLLQSKKMESLGQFAGGIAHDFNNVLTAIGGFAHLLKYDLENRDKDSAECIEHISLAVKFGKNLTSNLLTFGRKQIINPVNVELCQIINTISDMLKTLIPEEISLKISLAEDESPIFADPYQIGQMIINLCMNAKDAMPLGGELYIETDFFHMADEHAGKYATVPPGEYMILSVRDTGTGMDEKTMDQMFEPFFSTKKSGKGTGLGLTIVQSIVQQHDGFIDIESEMDKGTKFRIFFPVSGEHSHAMPVTEPEYKTITPEEGTLLVAEDDELVREFLWKLLAGRGYTVVLAEDGEEAIRKYLENRDSIDMLILDVVLPGRNGIEVYNCIKSDRPDIKTLFISGYTDDIITAAGIYDEDLQFLSKPLDAEELLRIVTATLQSAGIVRRSQREQYPETELIAIRGNGLMPIIIVSKEPAKDI